jgi:hypothetical protein
MARDAIELSLSARRDEGDKIPSPDAEHARLGTSPSPFAPHSLFVA